MVPDGCPAGSGGGGLRDSVPGPGRCRAGGDAGVRAVGGFNAVQNTYLSTFQVLGGLGLLLGSAGLGVVVLRNVLERRGELALLTAVGFQRGQLSRLIFLEHALLLVMGLVLGVGSAAVAVLPSLLAPTVELPLRSLGLTLGGVVALGLLVAWGAVRVSLRGRLLAAFAWRLNRDRLAGRGHCTHDPPWTARWASTNAAFAGGAPPLRRSRGC